MDKYSYKNLAFWRKAHEFVLLVYKLTNSFPNDEKFGLTSQLRRAAVSIAANIAEGYRRIGDKDKIKFFNYSQTSIDECSYYLLLAKDLQFSDSKILNQSEEKLGDVSKLLNAYVRTIKNKTTF